LRGGTKGRDGFYHDGVGGASTELRTAIGRAYGLDLSYKFK
jgi:hypothetical protein